jgi:hypothetical protein
MVAVVTVVVEMTTVVIEAVEMETVTETATETATITTEMENKAVMETITPDHQETKIRRQDKMGIIETEEELISAHVRHLLETRLNPKDTVVTHPEKVEQDHQVELAQIQY